VTGLGVQELRATAASALARSEPHLKCAAVEALCAASKRGALQIDCAGAIAVPDDPGRPARPLLVHPARVKKRRLGTPTGRAALIHALAHIEFNAINLALDAIARFVGLPPDYYMDWLRVAGEEARHFELLCTRLADLGHAYGDFPAHDGLWEAAYKTRQDVLARMALVPRILEARGLDVTPGLQARLQNVGDNHSAAILDVILRDEIGHVAVGNHWFQYLCVARGLDSQVTFFALCDAYSSKRPQPPFNLDARRRAGFQDAELKMLMESTRS